MTGHGTVGWVRQAYLFTCRGEFREQVSIQQKQCRRSGTTSRHGMNP